MSKKSDAATIDRRVDTIASLILSGKTTSTIRRNPTITKWNVHPRTLDTYIAKAREQIRAHGEFDKIDEFGRAVARYHHLYDLAVKQKDLSAARAVVKDLCNLYGISGPIHIKVEGNMAVTSFMEVVALADQHDTSQEDGDEDA
jgi:hypothetical protein